MLQCYEATFAFIAVKLREAIDAPETAADAVAAAEHAMLGARPLWSMVATMRPEHFLAFREFTDGASAIQSRNYKLVESLCPRPGGAARLARVPLGARGPRARAGRPAVAR